MSLFPLALFWNSLSKDTGFNGFEVHLRTELLNVLSKVLTLVFKISLGDPNPTFEVEVDPTTEGKPSAPNPLFQVVDALFCGPLAR